MRETAQSVHSIIIFSASLLLSLMSLYLYGSPCPERQYRYGVSFSFSSTIRWFSNLFSLSDLCIWATKSKPCIRRELDAHLERTNPPSGVTTVRRCIALIFDLKGSRCDIYLDVLW
ncbi:hypothetical protein HGRIS_012593 [Hohenbuehelia grisea]|uniref:Secreted protein n=1 Tax=Hohenbuehelia grisea TaxID=104357 RepID=A0ABR3ISQ7_9AGAR